MPCGGVTCAWNRNRRAVLQQHERTQGPPLCIGWRCLARIIATRGRILVGFAHIAELGTGKHISALWYPRDPILVHEGGRLVDTLDPFQLHRAVTIVAVAVWVLVESSFVGMPAKFPRPAGQFTKRLFGQRCQRTVMLHRHICRNCRQTETLPKIGNYHRILFNDGQSAGNGCTVEAYIGRGLGVRLRIIAKQAHIIRDHNRIFSCQKAGTLCLGALNPLRPRLVRARVTMIFIDNCNDRLVMSDCARRGGN